MKPNVLFENQLQVISLHKLFDQLHQKHGDPNLNPIYGAGQIQRPTIVFVFINPTARNVAAHKTWQGIKAPWLGTKQVWKLFYVCKLLNKKIYSEILNKKKNEWTPDFALELYTNIAKHNIYITNIVKATQPDAHKLSTKVFKAYLPLFWKEMLIIKPRLIVSFGSQVSSLILGKNIKISEWYGRLTTIVHSGHKFKVMPIYYPVGQGSRNMIKAIKALSSVESLRCRP